MTQTQYEQTGTKPHGENTATYNNPDRSASPKGCTHQKDP